MTLSFRRRAVNAVMLTLTGVCTFLVAGVLLVILGYLAWNGATSPVSYTHLTLPTSP
jgi:hypothetical protein